MQQWWVVYCACPRFCTHSCRKKWVNIQMLKYAQIYPEKVCSWPKHLGIWFSIKYLTGDLPKEDDVSLWDSHPEDYVSLWNKTQWMMCPFEIPPRGWCVPLKSHPVCDVFLWDPTQRMMCPFEIPPRGWCVPLRSHPEDDVSLRNLTQRIMCPSEIKPSGWCVPLNYRWLHVSVESSNWPYLHWVARISRVLKLTLSPLSGTYQ